MDKILTPGIVTSCDVRDVTNDLHADEPPENIRTEYENKFSAAGVPINFCIARFVNG